jgi:hypothetical protein
MLARCRIALLTLFVVSAAQAQSVPTSVLGKGWGLDHILIGLSDPAVAKETFGTKLGFSVVHGTRFPAPGLEQAIIQLPQAYIELLWPYQKPTKPVGLSAKLIAKRIESGGGPAAYNIDVSPASETAAILRGLGLMVTLPPSTRISSEGKEEPGPWQSVTISTEDTYKFLVGVPGGLGVGFGEYRDNPNHLGSDRFRLMREEAEREVPDAKRSPGEIHANTARKLVSVWVAVPNVVEAVKQSERFGFAPGAERQVAILGARGRFLVQRVLRHQLLELGVLLAQVPQLLRLGHFQAAVLLLPGIDGVLGHSHLPSHFFHFPA